MNRTVKLDLSDGLGQQTFALDSNIDAANPTLSLNNEISSVFWIKCLTKKRASKCAFSKNSAASVRET